MGVQLVQIGNKTNVPVHHYTCDTRRDLEELNTARIPMGSTAYIIDEGKRYIINSQQQWEEDFSIDYGPGGTSGGGGGGGGSDKNSIFYVSSASELDDLPAKVNDIAVQVEQIGALQCFTQMWILETASPKAWIQLKTTFDPSVLDNYALKTDIPQLAADGLYVTTTGDYAVGPSNRVLTQDEIAALVETEMSEIQIDKTQVNGTALTQSDKIIWYCGGANENE